MEHPTNGKVRTIRMEPQPALVRFCHHAIFYLVLYVLVFAPLAFGAVRPWAQWPIMGAVWLGALLWVVRLLAVREIPAVLSQVGAPVLALGMYAIVRYGLAEVEPVARHQMLVSVSVVLFFFLVLNHVRHRWQITVLMWVWTVMGVLLGLYGLWQVVGDAGWVWLYPQYERYAGRASGTFIQPGYYAGYLQMVIPIAVANFLFSRRTFSQKVSLFFACLVMSAGVLFSFARGSWLGWLASLIVLGVYVIRKRGSKFRWAVIGTSVLGVVVIGALVGLQAMREQPLAAGSESELHQLPQWRSAIQIGRSNLLLGAGPGMFRWLYPAHRTLQGRADAAGNEYLNFFAEYGLIGCVLAGWIAVGFIVAAMQILSVRAERYSAATPSNRYAFVVGALGAFAAVLVQAALDVNLHSPANAFTLAAMMAAVLTCGLHLRDLDDGAPNRPGEYAVVRLKGINKFAVVVAILAVLALLGLRARRSFPSYVFLRLAERAQADMHWAKAEKNYLRALNFDKRNFEAAAAFGDLYCARATWNSRQREEHLENALRRYQAAYTLNLHANDVLIKIARVYDLLGKRDQADERFTRALQADPNNASYHAQLGLHHLRWGEQDKAIASFRRAHDLGGPDPLPDLQLKRFGKLGS